MKREIPKSWGLVPLTIALAQLIITTRTVRTVPDLVLTAVIPQCTLILTLSLLGATILAGPLVAKGDERVHFWEAEKIASRPDFAVMNHRGFLEKRSNPAGAH